MEMLTELINTINGIVWGPMMLVLILGVGLFLQLGLKLMPILKLGTGFKLMWDGRSTKTGEQKVSKPEISEYSSSWLCMPCTLPI